jgi:Tol biopolymer transport system component
MPLRSRQLAGAAILLALGVFTGLSAGSAPSEAAFPGLNGRIVCEGDRRPELTIPSPNPLSISRSEIFDINPNGTGERVLTNNQTRDGDPAYSPDGTKIAFEGRRVAGQPDNSEIYVANNDGDLEGPDVRQLTFNNGERTGAARSQVAATDRSPSWSPDGTQIVFHSGRETTFADGGTTPINDFEIYKMSAITGEPGGLDRLTAVRGQDAIPSWSPDGTKIAFQSLRESTTTRNQNLEVFTMNPDGSQQTNISNNPGSENVPATPGNDNSNGLDRDPQWSPDGRQIVFTSTRSNVTPGNQNFEIYKMNRDGSGQTRLTLNLTGDTPGSTRDAEYGPSWSPDGRRILFTSGRTSGPSPLDDLVVYIMDSNAGEAAGLQRLTETDVFFAKCDWQRIRPARVPPRQRYPLPVASAPFADCPVTTANLVRGSAASERINGTPRADRIFAGTGNDVVDGLAGNDCLDLGPGTDRGQGGDGADLLVGGLGADRMVGNIGNDRLRGGSSGDRLNGGFGNDRLHGQSGADRVNGSRGRDRINGGSSNDLISAGSSGDRVAGDQGNDRINGNSGNDVLKGNSGRDRITGSTGADRIAGGGGNDRINARDGRRDRVNCGRGRDRVVADFRDRVARNCERVRRR